MINTGRGLTDFPISSQAKEQGRAEVEEMITKLEKVIYDVYLIVIRFCDW